MNIAITTTDASLDSMVFTELAQTPYLLIINVDTMEITPIAHTPAPGSDQELAKKIVASRCEALITGKIDDQAFDIIADDGVTRWNGANLPTREALQGMHQRSLPLIRNPEGTDTCGGDHHHHESCSGEHHH